MKVTRDFYNDGNDDILRWNAEIEGKHFACTTAIPRGYCGYTFADFEREAQRSIAAAIKRELFKERTL